MTVEEQIGFFSTLGDDLEKRFLANQRRVEAKIDAVLERTDSILQAVNTDSEPSSLVVGDLVGLPEVSMSDLTVAKLQLLHRAITDGTALPSAVRGALRNVRVWIGDAKAPIYEPPEPDSMLPQLVELLEWWRATYALAGKAELPAVVSALAKLHYELVAIHPFLDANGRLSRFIADQAARELLGRDIGVELTQDRGQYFKALRAANSGDLGPLERLIRAALM